MKRSTADEPLCSPRAGSGASRSAPPHFAPLVQRVPGGVLQFVGNCGRTRATARVVQFVQHGCPEVHRDGADLDCGEDVLGAFGQVHGHFGGQVQSAVPVGVGIGDVVLGLDDFGLVPV